MKLEPGIFSFDLHEVESRIEGFIDDYVAKTKAKGIVLGMSGGIDSSTAAALSAKAIGGGKVLGLLLPEKETRTATDIDHAKLVASKFKINTVTIDITTTLDSFYASIPIFNVQRQVVQR